jgi:hypothetical protein
MVASMIHLCYIIGYLDISIHFFIISPLSFRAENNLDQIDESLGTCSTFSKLPFVSSIFHLIVTSTRELSPIRIGGPLHASNEE